MAANDQHQNDSVGAESCDEMCIFKAGCCGVKKTNENAVLMQYPACNDVIAIVAVFVKCGGW